MTLKPAVILLGALTMFSVQGMILPISFESDGVKYSGIPDSWNPQCSVTTPESGATTETIRGVNPDNGMEISFERTAYHDFPVEEWMYVFRNPTGNNTGVMSDVLAADA